MKKVLFVLMALCFVSSLAFAAESTVTAAATDAATTATTTTTVTTATTTEAVAPIVVPVTTDAVITTTEVIVLKGDLIDNMCAGVNKDNLAEFIKTHTKECALKPGCIESGYSIFSDGKLYAFDKDSNAKVAEFLKLADSKSQVSITAKQVGDELNLVSIENQN
jgi:hypothetical protein